MKPQKIAVVDEEDSSLEKATPSGTGKADKNVDYAKLLQEFAEMKEELGKIPTKYGEKAEKSDNGSSELKGSDEEDLEMNLVNTVGAKDPNEETENLAYTENSKKQDASEANEYEEDFEKSNQYSEEVQDLEEKGENSVGKKSENKSAAKEEESEEKYEEEFEKEEQPSERKSDKKEEKFDKPVAKIDKNEKKTSKDVKKTSPAPRPQSKEAPKQANLPKLAQTAPAKNFKVKTVVNSKDVKKDVLPPKDTKETKDNKDNKDKKPPLNLKPVTSAKPPPVKKRPATATVPAARGNSKSKEEEKPKEEESSIKIEEDVPVEDVPIEEEENMAKSESSKSVSEKKPPIPAKRRASKTKKDTGAANFEIEENVIATESTNEPANVTKKLAATAGALSSKAQQRPKTESGIRKKSGAEEEADDGTLGKTQPANGVRIRTVKKLEPKNMMKDIFEEYKKKEEEMKKKDEKIFVVEETEKKIKGGSRSDVASEQENNWIGNGMGLTTGVFDTVKKKKADAPLTKKETGNQSTQGFAQKFLASLESKIGKTTKLGQEDNVEAEKPKSETGQLGDTKKEKTEKSKTKETKDAKKEQAQSKDKGWKYNVGEGVNSEYAKAQKEKEAQYQKKFTDLFKKEKEKQQAQKKENVQKLKEVMKRERENQKVQQATLVKNFRGKQSEEKEERDSKVLQVQNIYIEESERHKREQQKDEIAQLKLKLKLLKQQNDGLIKDLADLRHKDSDASKTLDSLASKKAVILLGKTDFTPLGLHTQQKKNNDISPQKAQNSSRQQILDEKELGDNLSAIEIIVNKFADQGFTLEQVYQLLDQNGDNLLTTKEIKEGLEKLELELEPSEIKELLSVIDKNSDGTVTIEEFVSSLQDSMKTRKEYKSIMGDLDQIINPIVLEERMLDISIRKKIIEEDMKKEADVVKVQEQEYKKLLRRLKEYEEIAGPQEEKKVDLDAYRDTILKLKIEIQDAEDMKSRTLLMQGERMKDITENIEALEIQIEKTIRRIHAEKAKIKDAAQEKQKEKIKNIFMKKVYGELEREINKFDYGIDNQVEKILEERQRMQARIEEEENQAVIGDQLMNGAAIKVQKAFRGSIARKRAKATSFGLIKAKNIILKKYRSYRRRTKFNTVSSALNEILKRHLKLGWFAIRAYSDFVLKERKAEEERQRALEEERQRALEEERERERLEEEERERLEEEERARAEEEVRKAEESKEDSRDLQEKMDEVSLYTVLYLQNMARKARGQSSDEAPLYSHQGEELRWCKVCNENPIERVCKICEVSVFCSKCFMETHRSRKNHPFIEVNQQTKDNFLLEKIQESDPDGMEELKYLKEKYSQDFVDLSKHFKDWDVDNSKAFDATRLKETLKRKVKDDNDLDFLIQFSKKHLKISKNDPRMDYLTLAMLLEP